MGSSHNEVHPTTIRVVILYFTGVVLSIKVVIVFFTSVVLSIKVVIVYFTSVVLSYQSCNFIFHRCFVNRGCNCIFH